MVRLPAHNRIAVSFSGGRTSAYMAKRIKDEYGGSHELVFTFANTAKEYEETLVFADRCDREFGLNLVWLEAVVDPNRGTGTRHRVVSFETASRSGEPFEDVIKKYGIPNTNFPHCNRELKLNPMNSYLSSIGWGPHNSLYAIGIRADEIDRMSESAQERGLWYPLVGWGVTKPFVLTWWGRQGFDLDLPEHKGNCDRCWKKSLRKLLTLAKDEPNRFEWWASMESAYAHAGAGIGPRTFYRNGLSAEEVLALSKKPFAPFIPSAHQTDLLGHLDALDREDSCGAESCEAA